MAAENGADRNDHEPRKRFHDAARKIFARRGLKGLTFDAVAKELGVSKQGVLHWYPTKTHLLAALVVPALRAEADAVKAACDVDGSKPPGAGLRALLRHHLADLERFRMVYLAPQVGPGIDFSGSREVAQEVHQVTDEMYAALAASIPSSSVADARRRAVALHASVVGILTMVSLGHSIGDPLKHEAEDLLEGLLVALHR